MSISIECLEGKKPCFNRDYQIETVAINPRLSVNSIWGAGNHEWLFQSWSHTYIALWWAGRFLSSERERREPTALSWTKADLQCSGFLSLQVAHVSWETEKEALPHLPLAAAASLSPSLCIRPTSWLLNHSCCCLSEWREWYLRDSTSLLYFPRPDSGAPPFRGSLWKSFPSLNIFTFPLFSLLP